MYVKVIDGVIAETMGALPECTDSVSGFNLLTSAEQAQHGYFPLTEVKPAFNSATEKLTGPVYSFGPATVTATYAKVKLTAVELNATLDSAKAAKIQELMQACATAIVSGFSSSALGSPYIYPSQPIDQSNLIGAVASGLDPVKFWCEDATGNWGLAAHSAVQIKQVLADGASQRINYSVKLDGLVKQVTGATSAAAISAIVW